MIYQRIGITFLGLFIFQMLMAQPEPCGPNPAMTSFCADACVICDIDGFTGINDLTAQGQGFPEFCTTGYNNMQYIAFIAGSESLTIQVDVGTCTGGINSLEVGFFESFDCQNFSPISECNTDIPSNQNYVFPTNVPLVIGQHYYLVIDGSAGANCDWTFTVLDGTTEVLPLTTSGVITSPTVTCAGVPTTFSTTAELGAAIFSWSINGIFQAGNSQETQLVFPQDGTYEVCVTASNVCDAAPPSCTTIIARTPEVTNIDEVLCDGECVEANGIQFCETGVYEERIPLPIGCDSIITISIEVLEQPQEAIDLWICNDESYFIGENAYNQTGSFIDTVLTTNDCDSLVFLELLVIECEIVGTPAEIPVICNGTASGTLVFSVDQGEPPLTYTYTNIFDPSITGTGTTNLLINNEIPNIPAGEYQIYIQDDFGNDVVVQQEITEPPFLNLSFTPSDYNGFSLSCAMDNGLEGNDGVLVANVIGGVPPYTYTWSDDQTNEVASGLEAGFYSVTVSDNVGCTITGIFTITAPSPIEAAVNFTGPNCDGFDTGEIEIVSVNGGIPTYTYSLDGINYSDSLLITGLQEGTYQVHIQDANGCVEIVDSSMTALLIPEIIALEDQVVLLGDSTLIQPILNTNLLSASTWVDPSASLNCLDCLEPYARPVNDAEYFLMVTSEDGCIATDSLTLRVEKRRRVYIPNVFSPNDDGINDQFTIFAGPEVEQVNSFKVYDRWGGKVFELTNFSANDIRLGWDGFFKGKRLDNAVFLWTAEVLFIDNEQLRYSGDVLLMD